MKMRPSTEGVKRTLSSHYPTLKRRYQDTKVNCYFILSIETQLKSTDKASMHKKSGRDNDNYCFEK